MKSLTATVWTIIILSLFLSCNTDEDMSIPEENLSPTAECVFEQIDDDRDGIIDDEERAILKECRNNLILSKEEAEENLIGK